MITGYGPFNECLFRRGELVGSPMCDECGELETFEHVLLECPAFEEERMELMNVFDNGQTLDLFLKNENSFKIFDDFCNKVSLLKWEVSNNIVHDET